MSSSDTPKPTLRPSKTSSSPHTNPSIRLLFTFLTLRDVLLLLLPAIFCSIVVGLVPTAMSKVVGKAFDSFALYTPSSDHHHFLSQILTTVYILLGLACVTFCISTVCVSAWICLAERTAARIRRAVFASVVGKKLAWYDCGMGLGKGGEEEEEVEISPAGIMTKVARETDDVRVAISRELGNVVQHLTTALASLALAMATSWSLTLVILASIPVVLVLTVVTEIGAAPWLQRERTSTSQATSLVEKVVEAINTVKSFNAQQKESERFQEELRRGCKSYRRTLLWWAIRYGVTGGLIFATFVQGFWFGSHLVSKGKVTPGQVMTVFMASLLVSSTLNEVVQALSYIDKGKIGAANLINLIKSEDVGPRNDTRQTSSIRSSGYIDEKPPSLSSNAFASGLSMVDVIDYDPRRAKAVPMSIGAIPSTPSPGLSDKFTPLPQPTPTRFAKRSVQGLRRISPSSCQGEIHLRGISFSYPSRPTQLVLDHVDLYFAPAETTYVVGGSGSGKSTISALLLRLYEPTTGTMQIDDQTIEFLDPSWYRQHIGAVSQDPIIFDLDVHDNVALGLVGKCDATGDNGVPKVAREDVESACRLALLHEFVRDLPEGYETLLGAKGTALSGGQRQRLAIARARLRDPSILILDEATSALDPTTRHLVHEAIKRWRKGKTTIIITHDLSQIGHDDFLYLLENGRVVQQGYRSDLEAKDGAFRAMSLQQQQKQESEPAVEHQEVLESASRTGVAHDEPFSRRRRRMKYRSMLGWEREASVLSENLSLIISQKMDGGAPSHLKPLRLAERQAMHSYWADAETLKATGSTALDRRVRNGAVQRRRWDAESPQLTSVSMEDSVSGESARVPTVREVYAILSRTIPNRILLLGGVFLCILSGTLTPIFSYILAQLLSTMGRPDQSAVVLKWSLLILLIALLEGIFAFSRYFFMEVLADEWLCSLRSTSYRKILAQDRTFFDRPSNSPAKLCQSIVKDGEDARNLVGQIVGQLALITTMIALGIVWALVVGRKLTLAGVAFGPVFLVAVLVQGKVIGFYEVRNKRKREAVAEAFHSMVLNIRSIRSMGLESVFDRIYQGAVDDAQRCGMRASVFAGFGHGMSDALTYIAEALIFYVGAKLMVSGEYDFKRMMQVFNLIIFAVTFAAQMLTFLPGISKSVKALTDVDRLVRLPTAGTEAKGELMLEVRGKIEFEDVGFAYEGREVKVVDGMRFSVEPGECVAIVGGSGCGKSTVAALLQRLYEPDSGSILIDGTPASSLSTTWLREHISVVGQNPALFDLTVAENIAYGSSTTLSLPLIQTAATAANAHTFITALPSAYTTRVTTGKLSGGQAQRLAIARALLRPTASILILDECTSALDVANQQSIIETLLSPASEVRKRGMTTLVITHNLDMMRRCDRLLVLKEGRVVEEGRFDELVARTGGYFASLTRGGEWTG